MSDLVKIHDSYVVSASQIILARSNGRSIQAWIKNGTESGTLENIQDEDGAIWERILKLSK